MKKNHFLLGMLLFVSFFDAAAKKIQVNVGDFMFSPSSFTVTVGDTIHFIWVNGFHTTTSTSVPSGALTWDHPMNSNSTSFLYIVKVAGKYSFQCNFHAAMGMVGNFTANPAASQPKAQISSIKHVSINNCTNKNSITFKCRLSKAPYKVQLFRYGVAFGSLRTVADTLPFTFSNLPLGNYYATARGHNGTDALTGKSGTTILMPVPAGLKALHISGTRATVKWIRYTCVKFYIVNYRVKGAATWKIANTMGNKDSINLTGLTLNTKYQFRVASVDSAHKIMAIGAFSSIDSFKTTASKPLAFDDELPDQKEINKGADIDPDVMAFPNPASSQLRVLIKHNSFVYALLEDMNGKVVWSVSSHVPLESGKELDIDVSNLPAGIYFLQLVDVNKKSTVKKIAVTK